MPKKRGPEEEWLNEPESEGEHDFHDPAHSPFEGDIPPWGQRGYGGEFPMQNKIFYVNCYTERRKQNPLKGTIYRDNLRKYGTRHWVGTVDQSLEMGADFDYIPFASIPVRLEDANRKDFFFKYLESLAKTIPLLFTHIVVQQSFPQSHQNERTKQYEGEVRLHDGRWFPYVMDPPFEHPKVQYVNGWVVNRLYGGPEEGGWWYNTGEPIAAIPFLKDWASTEKKWREYLMLTAGWASKYDLGSVLGHDNFELSQSDHFPRPYPTETPRYE